MEGQDWFSWSNIINEANDHHDDNADVHDSKNGQGSDWTLNELINDIEHQMGEQNDALAGMTKQLEGIEVSLSLAEAAESRSNKHKTMSYIRMGGGDHHEQQVSPTSSIRDMLRALQEKSFRKKRGDKNPDVRSDEATQSDINFNTILSSASRQSEDEQPNISGKRISILKSDTPSGGENHIPPTQALQIAVPFDEAAEKEDSIIPPPRPLDRQVTFDMAPTDPPFFSPSKHFRSCVTESASSNTESVVSDLEETLSGKTWAIRSRGAKMSVICLLLTLLLMLGLVIGQSQGAKRSAQTSSEQSINTGFDSSSPINATFAPSSAIEKPATTTSTPEDTVQPVTEPPSPPVMATPTSPTQTVPSVEETTQPVEEPTEPPVAVPVIITIVAPPVEPTPEATVEPTPGATDAPEEAPVEAPVAAAPTESQDDLSNGDTLTGYDYSANTDYLVGVYYYPWHGENFHNNGGYMRQDLQPPHQPALGEYNDSDPAVIAQHMSWFRKANIGLLVTSWWGPNRLEDTITKDVIMEHEDVGNLKIAIHYETTGRLGDGFDEVKNVKSDVEYMCEHYFDHPNYYRINGSPVVFLYISRVLQARGTLEEVVLTMRSAASKCGHNMYLIGDSVFESAPDPNVPYVPFWYFDAVTNYDVYGSAGRPEGFVGTEQVDKYYSQQASWKEEALVEKCHYIPAVSPGYNDRGVRMESDHPPLSRRITSTAQEGSLFHYQLSHAKLLTDENVDRMILVNSFNEWHEDTQIEPAVGEPTTIPFNFTKGLEYVGYGELYLDILGAATSRDTSQHTKFDFLFNP
jgi:glycoprotein endo-alpha-1,2-mannosidase